MVKLLGATLLYLALAYAGRTFCQTGQADFCILWLPAGLGLALVLLGGKRCIAVVFLGALIANLIHSGFTTAASFILSLGAAFEAWLGAWLLQRNTDFDPEFSRLVDFQRLMLLSGVAATLITAFAGAVLLALVGATAWGDWFSTLSRWWMGDMLGVVLVTPFILVWRNLPDAILPAKGERDAPSVLLWRRFPAGGESNSILFLEATVILGAAFLAGQAVFLGWFQNAFGNYAQGHFMYLFVVLAALRLGRHGTFSVLLMAAAQGLAGAHLGVGYFAGDIVASGLVNYWLYMVVLSAFGITLASYITEEQRERETLREQGQFFRMITDNIDDLVAVLDLNGRRLYNSAAYGRLFGDPNNLLHTDSFAEVHPDDREYVRQVFMDTVNTGAGQRIEFRFSLPDHSVHFMESRGGVIRNSKGELLYIVVVSHDITERRKAEETIRNLAYYDPLTQLPNRRMLQDRLAQAMAVGKRSGKYGALMMLDLDNFKPLNDQHGHGVGDLLLVEAAQRISHCVRQVDTVARLGGDEFVVVLSGLDASHDHSIQLAGAVAEKVRARLAEPYRIRAGRDDDPDAMIEHCCTSSIGLVTFFGHETSQENLLGWADQAMYRAKENGRNQICRHGG